MSDTSAERELLGTLPNPLGLDGIEYIEYATSRPQALGQVLESIGFKPVARHRSREVLLYRQGPMNIVVNANRGVIRSVGTMVEPTPSIRALALRVHDARAAYEQALAMGGWDVPMHANVMELNIPGIHGPGGSHIYFVDRYNEFSIYSVDFLPIPGADPNPAETAGMHFFGLVQYIGRDRTPDWVEFYERLLGFATLPQETHFGILHKGRLLQSPGPTPTCFYLQLIEPDAATVVYDEQELFQRVGFGVRDVLAVASSWQAAGMAFVETEMVRPTSRGAVTRTQLQTLSFELVHDLRP